jgi:polysaccharide export outer membrane protein
VGVKELATVVLATSMLGASGCSTSYPPLADSGSAANAPYLIGAGDTLTITVWRNPDLSTSLPVRPDGKITIPLVEDMQASGKTSTQLARDIEKALARYVQTPVVSVMITGFVGLYSQQVRVIGEAIKPQALAYRENMTLLDVMAAVGGITEFADGDRASILRTVDGKSQQFGVRLTSLLKRGDLSANVRMRPGDVLVIPQSLF